MASQVILGKPGTEPQRFETDERGIWYPVTRTGSPVTNDMVERRGLTPVTDRNTLLTLGASYVSPYRTAQEAEARGYFKPIGEARALAGLPPISTPIATPSSPRVSAPTFPQPTAPGIYESYAASLGGEVERNRKTVEDAYKKQFDDLSKQIETSQNRIADFTADQKGIITGEVQTLLQPFRETLENSERQRLYITENFEANQNLTRELDTLLTEGNTLITQMKGVTGLASIRNPRINKAIEDVSARAGVIQAVMSARSGQISEAYRMIDRSVNAITADRKDRLDYLNTLVKFYETQKDDEGKKLITLEKDQRDYINSQIGLLENDLKNSQDYAENIKKLMISPESAMLIAQAGVTLNMPPEEVNQKLATAVKNQQIEERKNKLIQQGYRFVPFPNLQGQNLYTETIGGQTISFVPPPVGKETTEIVKSTTLQRLLQGVGSLADLTPSEKQKVQDEAFREGLFEETPPDWFKKSVEQETQSSIIPTFLKQLWDEYRAPVKITFSSQADSTGGEIKNPFK